jgi:hypothetical protein
MTPLATDIVVADAYDRALLDRLALEHAAFGTELAELAQWPHGVDLARDLLLLLWQAAPRLRKPAEVVPSRRSHLSMISTLVEMSEVVDLRLLTVHDGWASAEACVELQLVLEHMLEVPAAQALTRSLARRGLRSARQTIGDEVALLASWGLNTQDRVALQGRDRSALIERFRAHSLVVLLDKMRQFSLSGTLAADIALPGRDEVYDVDLSDRLADVLPSELARLTSPALRLDLYRQLAEGALLTYRYRGEGNSARGPLVICLDVSDSMREADLAGTSRQDWAKAFTAALLMAARSQRRDAAVVTFSVRCRVHLFPVNAWSPTALLSVLDTPRGGGTDFAAGLKEGLRQASKLARRDGDHCDIVFVSDGECRLTYEELQQLTLAKTNRSTRVHGVSLGAEIDTDWPFADTVTPLSDYLLKVA